jgi:hypothetical protein
MNGQQRVMKRFPVNTKPFAKKEHERRAHVRYTVSKIVSFAHRDKQFLTVTTNLAMGGMKIKTNYSLPKNERLKFKMILGTKSISPEGMVVYNRTLPDKNRVSGIQFLGLSRRDSALLRAYLNAVKE